MARTVLLLHALKEVGRDDKDLQQLILGGGVNPINNKDPKAMLSESDRKVRFRAVGWLTRIVAYWFLVG